MLILATIFNLIVLVQTVSACETISKQNIEKLSQQKNSIVWFASWCTSCRDKILAMAPQSLQHATLVGVFDSKENIDQAFRYLIQNMRLDPNDVACYFDEHELLADRLSISTLP